MPPRSSSSPTPIDGATALRRGRELLDPVLVPHGFEFTEGRTADGPLGSHASGAYARGDRSIELHFRRILGAVVYHVGDLSLSHEAYMRAVLGLDGSYAGVSLSGRGQYAAADPDAGPRALPLVGVFD